MNENIKEEGCMMFLANTIPNNDRFSLMFISILCSFFNLSITFDYIYSSCGVAFINVRVCQERARTSDKNIYACTASFNKYIGTYVCCMWRMGANRTTLSQVQGGPSLGKRADGHQMV